MSFYPPGTQRVTSLGRLISCLQGMKEGGSVCLAPAAAQGGLIQNNLYRNMVYFEGAYFVPFFKKFIYLFYFWQC